MAESMTGLRRTHRCTEVSEKDIGQRVTVMGWVQKRRNLGALLFIDLRDRSGLLQVVFDEPKVGAEGFEKAGAAAVSDSCWGRLTSTAGEKGATVSADRMMGLACRGRVSSPASWESAFT